MSAFPAMFTPPLVVIYRGLTTAEVCAATEVLTEVGIAAYEVTLNSPGALSSISALCERFGEVASIGAGTVRSVEDVKAAADAGARYLISPHLDEDVVSETKAAGLVSIPGAFSPTEISRAWAAGADLVKVFPLAPVGTAFVRQIREPLDDIPLFVSGGVTADMARECLDAGCVCVGVGVGLFDQAAAAARDWPSVGAAARAYLRTMQGAGA
jgi:2-dehydro-3-deoxyphosphogluconate aldolase/(4S)-4-hydroxy-2-oxoglutarate aldolase